MVDKQGKGCVTSIVTIIGACSSQTALECHFSRGKLKTAHGTPLYIGGKLICFIIRSNFKSLASSLER